MPTQPYLPNTADAFADRQAEPEHIDFEILLLGYQRTGVLSGCAISEDPVTPDLTVDVASGVVLLNGSQITVSAQLNNAITTGAGSDRVDLVSINSSGTVVITDGVAGAIPEAPAIPASSVPLAFVFVPASDTTIENNQIVDKRVLVLPGPAQEETNVTLDKTHHIVNIDAAAFRTVTLPDNATFAGKEFIIHVDGTSGVNVTRAGSDTFDTGATTIRLIDGDAMRIVSIGDGEWKMLYA